MSTGECVMAVKKEFGQSSIWNEFEEVTESFCQGLLDNNPAAIIAGIRKNHQLLTMIKVVPENIKKFIAEIEKFGGAAKITGAGSIAGDCAGAVLIYSSTNTQALCQEYGFNYMEVEGDSHGLRIL